MAEKLQDVIGIMQKIDMKDTVLKRNPEELNAGFTISLLCPITLKELEYPGRGLTCKHLAVSIANDLLYIVL